MKWKYAYVCQKSVIEMRIQSFIEQGWYSFRMPMHSTVTKRNQIWLSSNYFISSSISANEKYFFGKFTADMWFRSSCFLRSWNSRVVRDYEAFFLGCLLSIKNFFRFGSDPVRRISWWNKQESESEKHIHQSQSVSQDTPPLFFSVLSLLISSDDFLRTMII